MNIDEINVGDIVRMVDLSLGTVNVVTVESIDGLRPTVVDEHGMRWSVDAGFLHPNRSGTT